MKIKFRVWDKSEKKMKRVYSIGFNEQGEAISIQDEFADNYEAYAMYDVNDYELMQSTGLKDKNGTEIYEGDIIDKGYLNGVHDEIGVVTFGTGFDSDGYQAESWLGWVTDKGSSVLDVHKKCEVIGNVFEDKNLLSEEELE